MVRKGDEIIFPKRVKTCEGWLGNVEVYNATGPCYVKFDSDQPGLTLQFGLYEHSQMEFLDEETNKS